MPWKKFQLVVSNRYQKYALVAGALACLIWAFGALVACYGERAPLLSFLAISQGTGCIAVAAWVTWRRRWGRVFSVPLWVTVAMMVLMTVNQVSYYLAFRLAPPAQVDLINYLWPFMLGLLAHLSPHLRLSWNYLLGMGLGFAGVAVLLVGEGSLWSPDHWPGWLLAVGAASSWVAICLLGRHYHQGASESLAILLGPSAVVFASLAFWMGQGVPTKSDALWIGLWGVTTYAGAYSLWSFGLRQGSVKALTLMSYAIPAVSVLFLVLAGFAAPTLLLLFACLLVTAGGLLGYRLERTY